MLLGIVASVISGLIAAMVATAKQRASAEDLPPGIRARAILLAVVGVLIPSQTTGQAAPRCLEVVAVGGASALLSAMQEATLILTEKPNSRGVRGVVWWQAFLESAELRSRAELEAIPWRPIGGDSIPRYRFSAEEIPCEGAGEPGAARDPGPTARQDTVGILQAAVAWADSKDRVHPRLLRAPLVVLERADRHAAPSPSDFPRGGFTRVEQEDLPFSRAVAEAEELSHVRVCAADRGPREARLCGLEPPWRVASIGFPTIQGDSATIGVALLPVETGYEGGSGFLLLLTRTPGGWEVAEARHSSEID